VVLEEDTHGGFMNLGRKIISVAAAAALIAGAGTLAAAPAAAKTKLIKKGSSTTITFDKAILGALSQSGITVSAEKPAKWNAAKGQITFPVTGVADGGAIIHSGGLTFTKDGGAPLTVTDPVIVPAPEGGRAEILVSSELTPDPIPLLVLKDLTGKAKGKVTGKSKKWLKKCTYRAQGQVHLTSNELVIGILQSLLSPAFTADLKLGAGVNVLVIETTSKDKKKPGKKCE